MSNEKCLNKCNETNDYQYPLSIYHYLYVHCSLIWNAIKQFLILLNDYHKIFYNAKILLDISSLRIIFIFI